MTLAWPRQQLAYPQPAAWASWLAAQPEGAALALLRDWVQQGNPLITRRATPHDPPQAVPLGLPLPPEHGKQRIALHLPPSAIAGYAPLPRLEASIPAAPLEWRPWLHGLAALGARYDIVTRVFGSLAWQYLTGLPYIGPNSDLDLIWNLPQQAQLPGLLQALDSYAATLPWRLDGEFLRRDGVGAHWRELHKNTGLLAVKHGTGVDLWTREAFLDN